ncbi:MAG: glycosyltransferase [Desulfobacterales bacterium]|nr:glycosyltransferase [Desulfobacterales bacterium]
MKKILLVNPHDTAQSGFSNPPLGLLYLAGTLRVHGFEVHLVDGCLKGKAAIDEALERLQPDAVGISCLTPGRHRALEIAAQAKKQNPKALTVLGGAHPTIMYRQILNHYPFVDAIVRGEGEHVFSELLQEKPMTDIKGLAFRQKDRILDTGLSVPVDNLDDLPMPAWDMVDLQCYPAIDRGTYHGIDLAAVPRISVIYSRGCSGRCHFCSSWWIWKGWRCRSAANMVDEIEWLYREQQIRHFCFADDALTVDRQATLALCDEIMRRDLRIVFHATTRSDCVDAEILRGLKAAGCYKIAVGVETASQHLLNRMGKDNEVESAERAIRLSKEAGLLTTALMIVGNVGETDATIAESLAFLRRSQPDDIGTVGGLWILPGTRLHADCKRSGYIDDEFWLSDAPYKIYTREHSLERLTNFKKRLMTYKNDAKGHPMSDPTPRHQSGDSFLAKWNRYVDSTVNEYSATSRWQGVDALHRELFQKIPAECSAVLDLGCGDGWSTNELIAMGKAAVGVTINPTEVRHARETYGIELHLQDMHDLQFPDGHFDCIYCRESFEHCVAPYIALCEMNRVLKPGGYALINIPDAVWIREDSHFSVLSPPQMHEMCYKCRFQIVRSGRTELGHYWYLARKVAAIDEPCPYPAPDPLAFQPAVDSSTENDAPEVSKPRIIGMLRIKNEAAWIADVLTKAADLVDGFVILDDGSTDATPAICRAHPRVLRYEWQNERETDEVRDKNRLLQWTLEENPDWVLALDGDEVLEDVAVATIRASIRTARPDVTKLGISFLYMWDSEDAYRIDGHYREVRHPRLFRVTGLPMAPEALTYSPSRYGSNFHCGSVPTNLPGEMQFLDVRVKHYGYFEARRRQEKKVFYATRDPDNASAGYYDHLTATDGIRLRAYRERSTAEVLRPDGSPDDALQALKRAGNPLWQSALFYTPDCQSHLDIGTNLGHTLKGLDPERITVIEAYGPAARELEHLYERVIQGDARDIVPDLAARNEFFDRITLFDVIEHLTRDEGETLLDQLETMALQEIVLFVPLETPALVESPAYREFMQRQFARIPADQHALQQHHAHWSPEDFERRGYIVTLIEDFHMPGFHAFFACKYFLKTTAELMQQRIAGYLADARPTGSVPADTPMPRATTSDAAAPVFGGIGAHSKVHAPSLVTHPEHIFIGERVMVRQGARLEAITDYRGHVYEPELRIGDGTQIELDAHIGAARSVRIGKKVMIAGRVTILDHDHGYRNPLQPPIDQPLDIAPIVIEDGAWLGENAVICKGVTIGRHAVVGTNSVVTRNVPPWGVVAGAPARLIKYYNHGTETWVESASEDRLKASIVIPVHNHCDYTRACIEAIVEETPEGVYEIIVVDNASSDATRELLDRHADRVLTIRNDTNRGFVEACNQGAAAARAPYVVFLNNDTLPQKGWLQALIDALEHHDKVGAVGAKLIYPDGRLQEAGAVVFSDGRSKNFGRGDDPDKPEYNRICEVDYCSGACLMVRRDLFESLGGFDMRYAPAYYEETDLCFGLRDQGYRILYAPACRVYHHGSVTADSNPQESVRKYIDINRSKFIQKWLHVIVEHEAPLEGRDRLYTSDRRLIGRRTMPDSACWAFDESGPELDMETFARQVHAQVKEWVAAGRHAEALSRLETLTRLRPDDAMAYNDLGALYYARGDKDLAQRCYHRAVELAPENLTFRKNLADFLFMEKGLVAESLSHYHYILEKHPRDVETLIALGHVCARCDQLDDAAAFFNQALAVDPDNAEVHRHLDSLHPSANKPNAGTEPDPECTDHELAQRLVSQERISEAIGVLERQVAASPEDALAHNDLGVLYYQTDRKDLALQCYERAIELVPQNLTFQKNLADFQCIELGRYVEAKQIYHKILKHNPGDDECRQALAFIADKEGLSRVNTETRPPAVPAVVTPPRHQSNKHQSGGRFGAERIVVVSNHRPWFDRGSSDLRIHHLLKIMIAQGADILFL